MQVAALLSLKMHVLLEEELMGVKPVEENGDLCGSSTSTKRMREEGSDGGGEEIWGQKWRDAIRRAFQRADEMAVTMCPCGSIGSRCSCHPMEVALGGSTAVVALLSPDHIVLGNCGDSRAVLCRDGRAIPLTRDHKVHLSLSHMLQEESTITLHYYYLLDSSLALRRYNTYLFY